ncbi:MAG: cobalt-precorrin-5B (C(1))-methyltransferase CbiD [Akkermansia sp.]
MSTPSPARHLRQGYSTGACVTACIVAALDTLLSPQVPISIDQGIAILFPDGETRTLPLKHRGRDFASIIKDGGDDPDCTHGAELYARVRRATPEEAKKGDYLLSIKTGLLIISAVEGIGLCTRPGLDCEQGHWAINKGPRRMITDNMALRDLDTGCFLAEIGVKNGEKLAKKTLNAQLGIIGGISILGTTGIVRPFSHEAYIETIRICMRSTRLMGYDEVILATGGRTQSAARKHLPNLPEVSFVCMGDFIGDSLRAAAEQQMKRVTVACMPGKLCKYAAGFENTHAHKVDQDMVLFLHTLVKIQPPTPENREAISLCASVRQALGYVPAPFHLPLYAALCQQAFHQFSSKASGIEFRLLVYDFDGELLLESHSTPTPPSCHL